MENDGCNKFVARMIMTTGILPNKYSAILLAYNHLLIFVGRQQCYKLRFQQQQKQFRGQWWI